MNNSFLTAAASYYGLSLDQVQNDSEIDTSTGEFIAVMRILMTPDDLIGVAERMKAMREEEAQRQREVQSESQSQLSEDELRRLYNSLPDKRKSYFGSFGRYLALYKQENGWPAVTSNADEFGGLQG